MPKANDLSVGIMAPVAQAEREAISRREGSAGHREGPGHAAGQPEWRRGAQARAGKGGAALHATVAANANAFAADLGDVLIQIKAGPHKSLADRCRAALASGREVSNRVTQSWPVPFANAPLPACAA